jgi:hypothetical protein
VGGRERERNSNGNKASGSKTSTSKRGLHALQNHELGNELQSSRNSYSALRSTRCLMHPASNANANTNTHITPPPYHHHCSSCNLHGGESIEFLQQQEQSNPSHNLRQRFQGRQASKAVSYHRQTLAAQRIFPYTALSVSYAHNVRAASNYMQPEMHEKLANHLPKMQHWQHGPSPKHLQARSKAQSFGDMLHSRGRHAVST